MTFPVHRTVCHLMIELSADARGKIVDRKFPTYMTGHITGAGGPRAGAVRGGIELPGSREGRKPRTSIPLGDKIALIDLTDAGHTWPETLDMFRLDISVSAARDIYRNQDTYKGRAAASEDLSATRLRRSYFGSISQALWAWYKTLQRVGGRHLPVLGGLLEAGA